MGQTSQITRVTVVVPVILIRTKTASRERKAVAPKDVGSTCIYLNMQTPEFEYIDIMVRIRVLVRVR